jgi:hypothetical protein
MGNGKCPSEFDEILRRHLAAVAFGGQIPLMLAPPTGAAF